MPRTTSIDTRYRPKFWLFTLTELALGAMLCAAAAWAATDQHWLGEFRVESEVRLGDSREPAGENLTLFAHGRVYDFVVRGPEEITIYDVRLGRFTLLDVSRRLKTSITAEELSQFTDAIRREALEASDDHRALAAPKLEHQYDEATSRHTLTSSRVVYGARGMAAIDDDAARQYHRFADWYARLNALRPGNAPPFARLELNEALYERKQVPAEVELTIYPKNRLLGRKWQARSTHLFTWRLLETDRVKIEKAASYLGQFRDTPLHEYLQLDQLAAQRR